MEIFPSGGVMTGRGALLKIYKNIEIIGSREIMAM